LRMNKTTKPGVNQVSPRAIVRKVLRGSVADTLKFPCARQFQAPVLIMPFKRTAGSNRRFRAAGLVDFIGFSNWKRGYQWLWCPFAVSTDRPHHAFGESA